MSAQPCNSLNEVTYKVEVWSDDETRLEQTLAVIEKITDAKRFVMAVRADYTGKKILIRQGIRQVWP